MAGESRGLTEVVRIVARVTGQVQVSAGGVYEFGYHVAWCPRYRRPVLAGRVAARCKELTRAKASEHSWRMAALEIMPDHVRLFVRAHLSDSPSRIVNQFKGLSSRRLRAEFPHLPTLWSRQYFRGHGRRRVCGNCTPAWRHAERTAVAGGTGPGQQQTLRRLNAVFASFYARAQKGKAGYPRFKPYSRFDQAGFVAGDGAKWTPAPAGGWARAAFQAVGSVKVRQHRPVPGTIKLLQLKREYRRWYVIVISDIEAEALPASGRAVGVDVGVARFATTSDEESVANPKFLAASAEVIADLQRRKDRARRGSGNRRRIRRQLAKEWRKVRNRRRDFHHKAARALVNTCDVIALEKLNVAGMTRRPAPKPDPGKAGAFLPNLATAKAGLNKSILDAGWAQFAASQQQKGGVFSLLNGDRGATLR